MKTKREILEWYLSKGNVPEDADDLRDFWDKIETDKIDIVEQTRDVSKKGIELCLILRKSNWRTPITLNFFDKQVYHITY